MAVAPRGVGKMALLTETEKKQVEQAVTQAEAGTAGELVVVLSERSADYAALRASLAASLSVAVALEFFYLFEGVAPWMLFLGQLPLALLIYRLLGCGAVLRLIVPKQLRAQAVEERALSAFLQAGVAETKARSGVLIFISEAEHRAVILADSGINELVAPDEWQKDVDSLVASIRSGHPAQGLLGVVERIGGILNEAFPAEVDNQNELSNVVREL